MVLIEFITGYIHSLSTHLSQVTLERKLWKSKRSENKHRASFVVVQFYAKPSTASTCKLIALRGHSNEPSALETKVPVILKQ